MLINSALNKRESAIPPLLNGLEVLSSTFVELFAEIISKNPDLDGSGISYLLSLLQLVCSSIISVLLARR